MDKIGQNENFLINRNSDLFNIMHNNMYESKNISKEIRIIKKDNLYEFMIINNNNNKTIIESKKYVSEKQLYKIIRDLNNKITITCINFDKQYFLNYDGNINNKEPTYAEIFNKPLIDLKQNKNLDCNT